MEFLKTFSVLLLDVDGVWFAGEETRVVDAAGAVYIAKTRDLQDGQGLSFLRALGIIVGFLNGESEPLKSIVEKINTLPSVKAGDWKPVSFVGGKSVVDIETWLAAHGVSWSDCVYVGDDRDDIEGMKKAAFVVIPANARRCVFPHAHLHLEARGGKGAVRELAEKVLDARGINEAVLSAS